MKYKVSGFPETRDLILFIIRGILVKAKYEMTLKEI